MRKKNKSKQRNSNQTRNRRNRKIRRIIQQRRNDAMREIHLEDDDYTLAPIINNETKLNHLIRSWVNCHGITTRAVGDLLQILNKAGKCNLK